MLPAILTLLAAVGCSEGDRTTSTPVAVGICGPVDPAVGFAVSDSGGVRIVENLSPEWGEPSSISISEMPIAVIGTREDDERDRIGRLSGAVLLSDGRVAIADGITSEVRIHSADGSWLRTFGGSGDGPGEFAQSISLRRARGDTLIVGHEFDLRYSRMLPDGSFVDSNWATQVPGAPRTAHSLYGVFGDGTFLVADRMGPSPEPTTGVLRARRVVRRMDPSTGALDSIGAIPQDEQFIYVFSSGSFAGLEPLFGKRRSFAVGDSLLYVGEGTDFEIEAHRAERGVSALIRICENPEPVDPADVERMIAAVLEDESGDWRATLEEVLDNAPVPEFAPAHLEMHSDAERRIWVRAFAPEWEDRTWRIFDSEGRWLGSAITPAAWTIRDIGRDRILISTVDEFGVESLRVFPFGA